MMLTSVASMQTQQVGETRVCRWKGDRRASFSIGGDDSLRSQLYFAIPEMDKRGIRGTWWINPGRGGAINYKGKDDERAHCWISCYPDWKAAAARGHDFANHSMKHLGAADYEEAEREVGETTRVIWETNPAQRLQLFDRGGGTDWRITEGELDEILARYDCIQGRGGGTEDPTWENNPSAETLIGYVETAIQEGSWHHVALHGIGVNCEWGGPMDGNAFIKLLDYLAGRRKQVWCGAHTEVHKYDQERSTAEVCTQAASANRLRITVTCSKDPRLYDYPLTLLTRVPASRKSATMTRKGTVIRLPVLAGFVQYEAVPGPEEIWLTSA